MSRFTLTLSRIVFSGIPAELPEFHSNFFLVAHIYVCVCMCVLERYQRNLSHTDEDKNRETSTERTKVDVEQQDRN